MKKYLLLCSLCYVFAFGALAQISPAIKNGGALYEVPEADNLGGWSKPYKIIMEAMHGVEKKDSLNPTLDRVARLINAYRHVGVPKQNIDIVVMIHYTATPIILNDAAYQKKFGVANPNIVLINELANYGVRFYVCGQSLHRRKYLHEPRNPNIKVVLSATYGITTLQMQGYVVTP